MKGAEIITRFAIFSKTEAKEVFSNIANEIKKPYKSLTFMNERVKLTNGKLSSLIRKESCIDFREDYENIYYIENCNNSFMKTWGKHIQSLNKIYDMYDIKILLDYEITIYNSHYPGFYFNNDFISFLDSINCNLTFDFYEG